jgi:hypothetical protein
MSFSCCHASPLFLHSNQPQISQVYMFHLSCMCWPAPSYVHCVLCKLIQTNSPGLAQRPEHGQVDMLL